MHLQFLGVDLNTRLFAVWAESDIVLCRSGPASPFRSTVAETSGNASVDEVAFTKGL